MSTNPTPTCAPVQPPLVYSPRFGTPFPNGWSPADFREWFPGAWDFNPWTGIRRPAAEVDADLYGEKLTPPTPACAPESPLRFSPHSGRAFASRGFTASEFRKNFPLSDWFYNPWTGSRRPAAEVEADPRCLKLEPPSHDPGTASPPTPATTEAGTGMQEPGATDWNPNVPPTPPPAPGSYAPLDSNVPPLSAVLSALGAAVTEVHTLTRTATELAAKCRALQEENDRLRGLFRQIAANADLSRFGRAVSAITKAALVQNPTTSAEEAQAQPSPHMRAGEVVREGSLLAALHRILNHTKYVEDGDSALSALGTIADEVRGQLDPHMSAAAGEGDEA